MRPIPAFRFPTPVAFPEGRTIATILERWTRQTRARRASRRKSRRIRQVTVTLTGRSKPHEASVSTAYVAIGTLVRRRVVIHTLDLHPLLPAWCRLELYWSSHTILFTSLIKMLLILDVFVSLALSVGIALAADLSRRSSHGKMRPQNQFHLWQSVVRHVIDI